MNIQLILIDLIYHYLCGAEFYIIEKFDRNMFDSPSLQVVYRMLLYV